MIEAAHLLEEVIRPVLENLGCPSVAAEKLLLGTAAQESGCGRYLRQLSGPAIGIYQMEPATFDDHHVNFLVYRSELLEKVQSFAAPWLFEDKQMAGNLYLATAMARVHYLRVKDPLPAPGDIEDMAEYWKNSYNTHQGKGTVAEFIENWDYYCGDIVWES